MTNRTISTAWRTKRILRPSPGWRCSQGHQQVTGWIVVRKYYLTLIHFATASAVTPCTQTCAPHIHCLVDADYNIPCCVSPSMHAIPECSRYPWICRPSQNAIGILSICRLSQNAVDIPSMCKLSQSQYAGYSSCIPLIYSVMTHSNYVCLMTHSYHVYPCSTLTMSFI